MYELKGVLRDAYISATKREHCTAASLFRQIRWTYCFIPVRRTPHRAVKEVLAKRGNVYPPKAHYPQLRPCYSTRCLAGESAGVMTYASEVSTFVSPTGVCATRHLLTPPSSRPCRPNIVSPSEKFHHPNRPHHVSGNLRPRFRTTNVSRGTSG